MTIQRLAELATAIADGESPETECMVEIKQQVSDAEFNVYYAPVKDFCLSNDDVVLVRTLLLEE